MQVALIIIQSTFDGYTHNIPYDIGKCLSLLPPYW